MILRTYLPRALIQCIPLPAIGHALTIPAPSAAFVETMKVATAVMVTVEIDFGPGVKSTAEALGEIERRHVPDDGKGRTFAILDAYGDRMADGRWHMSMHVSSEKAGLGQLVFRRTGEVLWSCRIIPGEKNPPQSETSASSSTTAAAP